MSYDNFITEVDAELRQEKAIAFWRRYGFSVIIAVILFILAISVYQIYQYEQMKKAGHIGDTLMKGLNFADVRNFDKAMEQLEILKETNFGGYPFLARLREASLLMEQGNAVKAVEVFDSIADDAGAPKILQRIAKIRAAYILVDVGTFDDVKKRVKDMESDIDPMRMSAREALGLAAYKEGNMDTAVHYFQKNSLEDIQKSTMISRARIMLDLIQAEGKATKE
ncbi:tetratricopeptide repeat protein [Bartonella sp. B41]